MFCQTHAQMQRLSLRAPTRQLAACRCCLACTRPASSSSAANDAARRGDDASRVDGPIGRPDQAADRSASSISPTSTRDSPDAAPARSASSFLRVQALEVEAEEAEAIKRRVQPVQDPADRPWTGEESTRDAVLRMLIDAGPKAIVVEKRGAPSVTERQLPGDDSRLIATGTPQLVDESAMRPWEFVRRK